MKIQKAYKTELSPNNKQITLFKKSCGAARYVFNWGLSRRKEEYEKIGKSSNAIEQHRELNKLKKTELNWLYEVSKCVGQEALRNLDRAYSNFLKKSNSFPKFKSKHDGKQGFRLTGSIYVVTGRIRLPRIGWIKLKEWDYLPCNAKINSATVSYKAGHWFVSIQVEEEIEIKPIVSTEVVGIDLGIKELVVCSNGIRFTNPKALAQKERRLKRYQKKMASQVKESNNRNKTKKKVAKVYYKISCIRRDFTQKATTELVRAKPRKIVVENLKVQNMMKNHKLAKSISDCGWSEIMRQLEYKCKWAGIEFIKADTYFASSKICHVCGYKNSGLMLADREWTCPMCLTKHNRDFNASKNLANYNTDSSLGIYACGGTGTNQSYKAGTKQEICVSQHKSL